MIAKASVVDKGTPSPNFVPTFTDIQKNKTAVVRSNLAEHKRK